MWHICEVFMVYNYVLGKKLWVNLCEELGFLSLEVLPKALSYVSRLWQANLGYGSKGPY